MNAFVAVAAAAALALHFDQGWWTLVWALLAVACASWDEP